MSNLPQPIKSELLSTSSFSPQKLAVARSLSQNMAIVQANELLAQDILNKVATLSELESQIIAQNPQAQARTDFIIKAFTLVSTQRFK